LKTEPDERAYRYFYSPNTFPCFMTVFILDKADGSLNGLEGNKTKSAA
jgi:hypothetical protein